MRGAFPITAIVSLGVHVLVAAALLRPAAPHEDSVDPAPQIAGETFELPAPESFAAAPSMAAPTPESATDVNEGEGDAPARPSPRPNVARAKQAPKHAEPGATDDPGTAPALYGAVGERSAADLATAFTRGFPQAASADPLWRRAPIGLAGEADVMLTLDESGHIAGTQVLGSPSSALSSAIARTLALIGNRPFVAKGKVTKLHLVATITTDAVHDGLHGDVFAIGGSYTGGEGSAFFALAIGRRIDVRVRAR